ncbi:MAG: hypothetical protein IKY53_04930 [Lachnospiraceae bacterium]|nr:hypothetical protein [Lachnospiraceae bacterium]
MSSTKSKSKKIICIVLAIIAVLTVGIIVAVKSPNKDKTSVSSNDESITQVDVISSEISNDETTNISTDSESSPVGGEVMTELVVADGVAPTEKEDIIALYNLAANKVKTEAKKVTRNFKNTRYDTSKSVLPSALESMANPMIEKYVKDDVEPVDYITKEEIIENYPAPKQTYSSKLTVADVDEATCVDNGKEYVVTLKLASCKNPVAGVKVGAACHIMDVSAISSSDSSMIKKFDAVYEGCVIKCKIDKATNRVTWANFYTPFTIDAVVKILFSEVVTIAVMSYERDYTITY